MQSLELLPSIICLSPHRLCLHQDPPANEQLSSESRLLWHKVLSLTAARPLAAYKPDSPENTSLSF